MIDTDFDISDTMTEAEALAIIEELEHERDSLSEREREIDDQIEDLETRLRQIQQHAAKAAEGALPENIKNLCEKTFESLRDPRNSFSLKAFAVQVLELNKQRK